MNSPKNYIYFPRKDYLFPYTGSCFRAISFSPQQNTYRGNVVCLADTRRPMVWRRGWPTPPPSCWGGESFSPVSDIQVVFFSLSYFLVISGCKFRYISKTKINENVGHHYLFFITRAAGFNMFLVTKILHHSVQ